ncbi:MAG TPA: hypothetical protein VFW96_23745 [Thermomicrobiales bacterium]|nr:hypothetical protein [Thermomicrobiales bacterium]
MTALTLDLPADLYERLRAEAARQGRPPEAVARAWLAERLPAPGPAASRERSVAAMRAAGLLAEPRAAMRARAAGATMTLAEVSAALDRAGGKPLSELVLEQRGPKA